MVSLYYSRRKIFQTFRCGTPGEKGGFRIAHAAFDGVPDACPALTRIKESTPSNAGFACARRKAALSAYRQS
jgi:hypothetical protein